MNYRQINMERTKKDLQKALSSPDFKVINAIESIELLDDSLNVLSERLREWYNLYFPEASAVVKSHASFAKIITAGDFKDKLKELFPKRSGGEMSGKDLHAIKVLAKSISEGYATKEELEEYLQKLLKNYCSNLFAVGGAAVSAKLISSVGSLERLAEVPSSTIQLLGAEKALFRHLKTGAKPPKYGIILHHNLLQNTPQRLRGKAARVLAGKLSIAAKRDFFGGDYMGDELAKDLEERIRRLRK
jgi:nucleolar protein 56